MEARPPSGRWTILRILIPALPWLLGVALTAIEPHYLLALGTNSGGIVALLITVAITVVGWLSFPMVASLSPGPMAYIVRSVWAVTVVVPGSLVILFGPAIIIVLRTFSRT